MVGSTLVLMVFAVVWKLDEKYILVQRSYGEDAGACEVGKLRWV